MVSASPTIVTKVLLPTRRPNLLHRARLVDFIHDHIERKVILVSAGAGYGKTSVLTDYVHDTDLPVCWLSLDEGDQDLSLFVEYLVRAVQHRFPGFGEQTLDLLRSGGSALDSRALVGAFSSDILQGIAGYFVIVLDDYHLMDDSLAVNGFIDLFLHRMPENCHIILSSRTLPTKLTLTRLVARQEIAGLGVSELRFTAPEIKALLKQNYDMDVSDGQATDLAERSEGWITGILLTTHDLWSGLFRNLIQVQGDEGQVFDYLANEVFALQPPDIQRFLMSTSILTRMSPDLCNELLDISNSSEILRALENRNLFTFQLESNWYRYHHLFQAFLSSKGRKQDPEAFRDLQGKAGQLLMRRGLASEATGLFLAAEHWQEAAEAIERATAQCWEKGQWSTLSRWIDTLPLSLLPEHPWLAHYRGKVLFEGGDFSAAHRWFEMAGNAFAQRNDQAGLAQVLAEESFVWLNSGDHARAIGNSKEVLRILGQDGSSLLAGKAHRGVGLSYIMQGDAHSGIAELLQALAIYERHNRTYDMALAHHDLGSAYERVGNVGRSKMHLQQALKYWERLSNVAGLGNTLNSLGVIQHSEGNYAEALDTLERALANIRLAGVPLTEAYSLASLGDLYKELGEFHESLSSFEQALELGKRHDLVFITLYALLAMGTIYAIQGNLEASSYYIDQADEIAARSNSRFNEGLYHMARGIQLYRQSDLGTRTANLASSRAQLEAAAAILSSSGAKIELTRTYLHLAQACLLQDDLAQTDRYLEAVVTEAGDLDQLQFIVAEARGLPRLIQRGIDQKIGGQFYAEIGAKLHKLLRLKVSNLRKEEPSEEATAPVALEARALGESYVAKDGKVLTSADWGASVAKELFFYLLDHPEGVRKDQVIDVFWHDVSASKGNSNFHSTTYRIRRALYPECLVRESGLYRLVLDVPHMYDVAKFEQLIDQGRGATHLMEPSFQQAIALYRGEYMADTYADWCLERREQLREVCVGALQALATHYMGHGRYAEGIQLGKKAVAMDPFDEAMYRHLMESYCLAGDRPDAIQCYQECAQVLRNELGVEPSSETRDLYRKILDAEY